MTLFNQSHRFYRFQFTLLLLLTLILGSTSSHAAGFSIPKFISDYLAAQKAAAQKAAQPPAAKQSTFVGMNTPFMFFDESKHPAQIKALQDMGVQWVRIDLHWDRIEPQKGQYDVAALDKLMQKVKDAGLQPVVYLVGSAPFINSAPTGTTFELDTWPPTDNAVYASRMVMLAKRYSWVEYWQIWNEPNISTFWKPQPDADKFGALVKSVRDAFNADPSLASKKLVLGGMAYYSQIPGTDKLMLQALRDNGTLKLVDVVAYHPYTETPEGDPDPVDPNNFITRATLMNKLLRDAGVKQIWATEFGWSSYTGPVDFQAQITEAQQADYLNRRLTMMKKLDFDRVFVFALQELEPWVSNRDQHYGMIRLDGSQKPAYTAVKNWIQQNN